VLIFVYQIPMINFLFIAPKQKKMNSSGSNQRASQVSDDNTTASTDRGPLPGVVVEVDEDDAESGEIGSELHELHDS